MITTYLIKELRSNSSLKEGNRTEKRSTFHEDENMAGASYAQVQWEGLGQQRPGCWEAMQAEEKAVPLSSGVALKSIAQKHGAQ